MKKIIFIVAAVLTISLVMAVPAMALPGKPDFGPHIYVDGETWGTKATTPLPAPRGNNAQSFDNLYWVANSNNPNQDMDPNNGHDVILIADAAPGDKDYNGGRWRTIEVRWTEQAFIDHGTVPVLTSDADFAVHVGLGHLTFVQPPTDPNAPPPYFSCPLLPDKES